MKYENEIREMLTKYPTIVEPVSTIKIDTDLRTVGMSSLIFISLITDIEDKISIEFPIDKLVMEEASSIYKLCNVIISCLRDGDKFRD